ncbi:MAG: DUF459 domain-containing protein [Archangiaceae bacterium]|nr:DUF459 domain-containing protein [Archangiaceae bacterium]
MTAPSPDLASALQQLTEDPPPPERRYRPREVAVVLATFACCTLLLESEPLLAWSQRFEANGLQVRLHAALATLDEGAQRVGLTRPRRALLGAERALAAGLKWSGEEQWGRVESASAMTALSAELGEPVEAALPEPEPVPVPVPEADVGPAANDAPPAPTEQLGTVLLTGDSLIAGGLATVLSRTLARRGDLRVVHAFQIGTGLANPEVFDWAAQLPPLVAREDPQLAICSLGANDGVALKEGNRVLAFGDPEWRRVYRQRVEALMRALSANGARVLWLGLPPMRDGRLARRAQVLNKVFAEAADQVPRVEYLEVGMLLSGPDGAFATFGKQGDARRVRLRLDDGVHYSQAGARAIARWVMDWVRERFPKRR